MTKESSNVPTRFDADKALKKAAKKARRAQEALDAARALEAEALAASEAQKHQKSEPLAIPARLDETNNGMLVLLTQEEVAAILKVSPRTLEGWRFKKTVGAPAYKRQHGRIRYLARDVNAYIDSLSDTTDAGVA